MKNKAAFAWAAAIIVPLAYLFLYTPYGMDTTDFGYFYGYGWRILNGEMPYRDFSYIKPAFPLYWHALWMFLTPENLLVLGGKAGFWLTMLLTSWFGSLFLARICDLGKMNLPLPLLATCAFVFGVHSFPHMPWHTPDGVMFSSTALLGAACGHPVISGIAATCALLCKQSFLFIPVAILALFLAGANSKKNASLFLLTVFFLLCLVWAWLYANDAWIPFRKMTTGQLAVSEALDAGIYIYLRQNWIIPLLALAPWLCARFLKLKIPALLTPGYCYPAILAAWYIYRVFSTREWLGFGFSWPTLFMLLGAACVLRPRIFLLPFKIETNSLPYTVIGLGSALLTAWSAAISGGYKIPAFFAAPLVLSFLLFQPLFRTSIYRVAWWTLICGLAMFWCGYQYPYTFPQRPLAFADFKYDAGNIYPRASHVMVDRVMYEKLRDFKQLRAKYGPRYKTLPGFTLSYFLEADTPVYGSDWLIDWEINGEVNRLYQELLDKKLVVFMEKDQMDTVKADAYERASYGVPQLVRKNWRIVEETPHFAVFIPPD